ncbi:MAG: class I SAM-dependent methyltransferase [Coleofasciculus sp. D1-CHI-01]|uniref:class I SAM-dependent methyltransferase n=1 Tax=Coleofasciculus sp. D1-CHI-01 TaxID=3068482 RepID=UPI0033053006
MGLLSIEELNSILACPKCQQRLNRTDDSYYCTNENCNYYQTNNFTIVDNYPVIVDFEQSILNKKEIISNPGASVILRNTNPLKKRLKKLLFTNATSNISQHNAIYFKSLLETASSNPVVLIIGGASKGRGTQLLYDSQSLQLISFDLYGTPLTQFIADAHQIPLVDQSIDAVWIQYVLEHVLEPKQVVSEIYRVLKKGGIVYSETPFMQQVHEGPYDFTRFTESGHRWLFKKFELIDSGVVMGAGTQLMWTIEHVVRGVFQSVYVGKIVKILLFWLQYIDKIIPQGYTIDNACSIYFLGRKADKELCPRDIVGYYKGASKIVR